MRTLKEDVFIEKNVKYNARDLMVRFAVPAIFFPVRFFICYSLIAVAAAFFGSSSGRKKCHEQAVAIKIDNDLTI
jgi:hypothetical protein